MFTWLTDKIVNILIAIGSILIAIFIGVRSAKKTSKLETQLEEERKQHETEKEKSKVEADTLIKGVENANEVTRTVDRMPDSDVDQRLRDKWSD